MVHVVRAEAAVHADERLVGRASEVERTAAVAADRGRVVDGRVRRRIDVDA